MQLDLEAQKKTMELQLKNVSWTQKKQVMKQFEDNETKAKEAK